jgi:hypothetical protein
MHNKKSWSLVLIVICTLVFTSLMFVHCGKSGDGASVSLTMKAVQ